MQNRSLKILFLVVGVLGAALILAAVGIYINNRGAMIRPDVSSNRFVGTWACDYTANMQTCDGEPVDTSGHSYLWNFYADGTFRWQAIVVLAIDPDKPTKTKMTVRGKYTLTDKVITIEPVDVQPNDPGKYDMSKCDFRYEFLADRVTLDSSQEKIYLFKQ